MEHTSEHLVQSLEKLAFPVRRTLGIMTRYYMDQLASEHFHAAPDELAAALAEIRRALTCRTLVSEKLSRNDQAQALEVLSKHVPAPLADERPGSELSRLDAILQEVSIGLICWHARTATTFALFELDRDRLPDYERFQHGDFVIVRAADRTSYPYNGQTGTFLRYSDPRIGHHDRWAVLDLDSEPDDEHALIRPAHLDLAPEEDVLASHPTSEDETEDKAWREGEPVEIYERLGTWSRDGFTLHLYDTGQVDRLGKCILAYELYDENFEHFGEEPIFQGADFHCSPLRDRASDATVADLLGFLSQSPATSDSERLTDYAAAQHRWCTVRAQDLALVAEEYQQRHEWRELHLAGQTEEAVLTVAQRGRAEDIFEVLALDIFEAYDVVEELCLRQDDSPYSDLGRLLAELHYLRNVEIVGGEDELARLYE